MSHKKPLLPFEALTMAEMMAATGIKRTTLVYQLRKKQWRYKGAEGAFKRSGVWLFHPAATLVREPRKPGPGRPRKLGYPRTARQIKKK